MIVKALQGQTWDMIAYEHYDNELLSTVLMNHNPNLHGVAVFEGGEEIYIPELEETEGTTWN